MKLSKGMGGDEVSFGPDVASEARREDGICFKVRTMLSSTVPLLGWLRKCFRSGRLSDAVRPRNMRIGSDLGSFVSISSAIMPSWRGGTGFLNNVKLFTMILERKAI